MITDYQALCLLRKQAALSIANIERLGGPVDRIQRLIVNQQPKYKLRSSARLHQLLCDNGIFPWSRFWFTPINDLYALHSARQPIEIEHQFRALYEMAAAVIDAKIELVSPDVRHGALFFAGLYLMAFVKPRFAEYARFRVEAKAKATAYFLALINDLRDDSSPGSVLIKGKAAGNIFVANWNSTPLAERSSDAMKELVESSGYLDWLDQQIELFPKLEDLPFNALVVASRFRRRDLYPRFHNALDAANPNFASSKDFHDGDDGDLADFRTWLHEQPVPSINSAKE